MRWIYLSPHLDDAVLSAGGLIFDQSQSGTPVEIWTLLAGFPSDREYSTFAQLQHFLWGFPSAEEAVRSRREEDRRAAAILGAQFLHFDFLDCIYRRGPNGGWLYEDISVPPHPQDADLPRQIAQAISPHLQPDDIIVCQLAIGSHVDHVLVRQGAELTGRTLNYDIDIPYFFTKPEEFEQKSAGMIETVLPISDSGLKAWQEAVLEYKSQLSLLGEAMYPPENMRGTLESYKAQRGGLPILQFGKDVTGLL